MCAHVHVCDTIDAITIYDVQDTEHIESRFDTKINLGYDVFERVLSPVSICANIDTILEKYHDKQDTIFAPLFPSLDAIYDVNIAIYYPLKNPIIIHVQMNQVLSIASLYLAHATSYSIINAIAKYGEHARINGNFSFHNRANCADIVMFRELSDLFYDGHYSVKMDNNDCILFSLGCDSIR